jgi:formylglycine-generating enzyme required for sulfatase activity
VSWHEAAAFAEFSGKSLQTVHRWYFAGGPPNIRHDVRFGNFSSGPAQVSRLRDLGALGTDGLAGNVKEWTCVHHSTQRSRPSPKQKIGRTNGFLPHAYRKRPEAAVRTARHTSGAEEHVLLDSGHVPERISVIREVLDWLDRTLGPVRTN